ncbi:MAG: tRNA pseudouridine(55) synthase TruB [Pseudomonadales bacterium]|nr:tRNA pseudouridine(55) synthase TruB [Pseudomonadales bacterium]
MARRRGKGRDVNGILLLDKPAGMTSNGALQQVKRLYKAAKAGHTGSLDPLATGVLPLCFGEATKFSQFLLDADKRYSTTITLGVSTTTGDADGEVVKEETPGTYSENEIEAVLERFRGEIDQTPSMYSAVKVNGKPLYKLARQGIEIERKSRRVRIYSLSLKSREGDRLALDITCSKGTYIRSLAEDIGDALGCGGHISALRRLGSGPFDVEDTHTLEELESLAESEGLEALDRQLLPASAAVQDWPAVELTELMSSWVRQGQPVQIPHAPTEGWVRIFLESDDDDEREFIGVGEILGDGRVAPRRLVAVSQ